MLLTCDHLDDDRPLLLDAVLVRESGVAAVVGLGVVEEDVGEVEIPVQPGGQPAVLPHGLHGGEGRLDGPGERSREGTCGTRWPCSVWVTLMKDMGHQTVMTVHIPLTFR